MQLEDSVSFEQPGQRVLWVPSLLLVFWLLFSQRPFWQLAFWQRSSWLLLFWRALLFWRPAFWLRLLFWRALPF